MLIGVSSLLYVCIVRLVRDCDFVCIVLIVDCLIRLSMFCIVSIDVIGGVLLRSWWMLDDGLYFGFIVKMLVVFY